ncbi:Flap endonuclease GEN 1 [Merluccius polli]|uniref:Flap endonuclease GEN homolog 1 n=1 Tax=Merluccius polli TaxID=89951 RepID=A0AA47MWU6_MERPO|nr:Flap endonuclease GEN 1 [Merluccius polli]
MGVKGLWHIIRPIAESVPLYSLTGKTLAVDLSLWVCEAQHVQGMIGKVTKPHLRNLFFRVSSLTLMGVKLVFVMEGEAPKLKAETMSKRTEQRCGGKAAPKPTKSTGRGRFDAVLRECAEMLDCLGVPWVTAAGEAEAMCAYLDSQGLVDGCITNDGDAFLYGAKTDPLVDCYQTSRIQSELHLSRENLVGLAILLGCDYIPKGIPGVRKQNVLKLVQTLKGETLLQRFRKWREEGPCVPEGATKKVPHCNLCRHPGSAKAHERRGCMLCHSQQFCQPQDFDYQCPCDWHSTQQIQQANSFEAAIREQIIEEFLISKDKHVPNFRRLKPNLLPMQNFAYRKMEWPKHYTSKKLLVLMTYAELMNRICQKEASTLIKPLRILKPRVRNDVACFEIVWRTPEHYAFPEDDPAEGQDEVRTVEEGALFSRAYPDMVDCYRLDKDLAEENKTKKKKVKSKKEKPTDMCDGLTDLLAQMNLQSSAALNLDASEQSAPPPPQTATTTPEHSPETILLDTPVPQTQHLKPGDCHPSHSEESDSSPLLHFDATASPSLSSIINRLHLSDIDWDGSSFTSSPPARPAPSVSVPEPQAAPGKGGGGGVEKNLPTGGVALKAGRVGPGPAQEMSYMEVSLRERLLMRNMANMDISSQTKTDEDLATQRLLYRAQSQGPLRGPAPVKAATNTQLSHKCHVVDGKKTAECGQSGADEAYRDHHISKRGAVPLARVHSKGVDGGSGACKPQTHSDRVCVTLTSASLIPRRCHSDPVIRGDGDRKPLPQSTKRSVCTTACSSSEDSGAENQPAGIQRKAKSKPLRHMKLKPTSKATMAPKTAANGAPDVFITCAPSSPVTALDCSSDDSLSCSDSPLPLAERVRLKYLMNAKESH